MKSFILIVTMIVGGMAFANQAPVDSTQDDVKAVKAKKCARAIGRFKNIYKDDFGGKKKSIEMLKGDDEDSAIPSGKKVKTAKYIEETSEEIAITVKDKKGKVIISKGRPLSCRVVDTGKPGKKPKDKVKDELDELEKYVKNTDLTTSEGLKKKQKLKEVARICKDVTRSYRYILRRAEKLERALEEAQASNRESGGNALE